MQYQQACVGAFIRNNEGKFLLVKRSEKDDFMSGMWELPGGGVDYGEEPQDGLKREVKEECGLDVTVGYPLVVKTHQMQKGEDDIQRVEITFLCHLTNEDHAITLSSEHTEYEWVSREEISNFHLSDYMKKVVMDCINNPLLNS